MTENQKDYIEYLKTPHWQKIKDGMYQRYRRCQSCGTTKGLNVHHKTYAHIGHEKFSELKLLCRECHFRTHRLTKGFFYLKPSDMFYFIGAFLKKVYQVYRIT